MFHFFQVCRAFILNNLDRLYIIQKFQVWLLSLYRGVEMSAMSVLDKIVNIISNKSKVKWTKRMLKYFQEKETTN